jgi:hypothetical protein
MATLEKLLDVGSFGIIVGHLACRQITLPSSLRGGLAFPQWFDLLPSLSWDVGL